MKNTVQRNNVALTVGTSRRWSLWRLGLLPIAFMLGLTPFAWLSPVARADCQQGCDTSNENTFLGDMALYWNTGGTVNTAIGAFALEFNTSGSDNTAVGAYTLFDNTIGNSNTAVGSSALGDSSENINNNTAIGRDALLEDGGDNNTGIGYQTLENSAGSNNTATGFQAMFGSFPTTGSNNTATGYQALLNFSTGNSNTANGYLALGLNTTGSFNTASGRGALYHNTTASNNVATGYQALNSNKTGTGNTATGTQALQLDTGPGNTADGYQALNKNTLGFQNVATGSQALFANTSGFTNTAVGGFALGNSQTGAGNIAIGFNAGSAMTNGSNNVDIANTGANESSTIRIGSSNQTNTYIAGISGVTLAGGIGVIVDSSGHLGTSTSSARYKENIQPMEKASEAILSLQPVTFRYKKELDPKAIPQFGLVAEQVEKVDPELVARDSDGRPYSVRYEAVNTMLLNEFLKEHRRIQEQAKALGRGEGQIAQLKFDLTEQRKNFETLITQQQTQIGALTAGLQKVSARLETSRPSTRVMADK